MKMLICSLLFTLSVVCSSAQVISFNIDESKLSQPLANQLDSIYRLDQSVRYAYMKALKDSATTELADSCCV